MISTNLQNKLIEVAQAHYLRPNSEKKHFTFIVQRNRILSVGYNNGWKSHPLAAKFGCRYDAIHAELDAILNFPYPPKELSRCRMVNIRLLKSKLPAMARPCSRCIELLSLFNVGEVIYTDMNGVFVGL